MNREILRLPPFIPCLSLAFDLLIISFQVRIHKAIMKSMRQFELSMHVCVCVCVCVPNCWIYLIGPSGGGLTSLLCINPNNLGEIGKLRNAKQTMID